MSKVKINPGLASILLLASLFSGWQTMLIVGAILFTFCELDEKTKGIAITVISFYVGYAVVSLGWDLIESLLDLIPGLLTDFFGLINKISETPSLEFLEFQVNASKFVTNTLGMVSTAVSIIFAFVKFSFIVNVLAGKDTNKFFMSNIFKKYIAQAVNFINGTVAAPATPVAPMGMQPTVAPAVAPVQSAPVAPAQPAAPAPVQPTNPQQ